MAAPVREGSDGGEGVGELATVRDATEAGPDTAVAVDQQRRRRLQDAIARSEVWSVGEIDVDVRDVRMLRRDLGERSAHLGAAGAELGAELHDRDAVAAFMCGEIGDIHLLVVDHAHPPLPCSPEQADRRGGDEKRAGDEKSGGDGHAPRVRAPPVSEAACCEP